MANSNGNGRTWPSVSNVILGTISIMFMLAVGFWYLADPRASISEQRTTFSAEIKDIRANYLSIREHQAFETRVGRDIQRLEEENKAQSKDMLPRLEYDTLTRERDRARESRNKQLEELMHNSATKTELAAHLQHDKEGLESLRREIDVLHRQIDALTARLNVAKMPP